MPFKLTDKKKADFLLVLLALFCLTLTGYFFRENRDYRVANRMLIIQNDSIISANILLQRSLQLLTPDKTSKIP